MAAAFGAVTVILNYLRKVPVLHASTNPRLIDRKLDSAIAGAIVVCLMFTFICFYNVAFPFPWTFLLLPPWLLLAVVIGYKTLYPKPPGLSIKELLHVLLETSFYLFSIVLVPFAAAFYSTASTTTQIGVIFAIFAFREGSMALRHYIR